jgi:hypothetical protein
MFTLPTNTLWALVQEMLVQSGEKLTDRNGLVGRSTQAAIEAFCQQHGVHSCEPTVVTVEFLATLVRSVPETKSSSVQ